MSISISLPVATAADRQGRKVDPAVIHQAGAELAALATRQQVILEEFNDLYARVHAQHNKLPPCSREQKELFALFHQLIRLNPCIGCVTKMRLAAQSLQEYER